MGNDARERMPYPSDGTDEEGEILEPLIPGTKPGGRPQERERREILNAIPSVLRRGCPWRRIPQDVPRWCTASWSFRQGKRAGSWEQVHAALRRAVRVQMGREAEPRAAMLDSPSITSRAVRGDTRGDDGGKTRRGRTRQVLVDPQGVLMAVTVLEASLGDREGGRA